MVGSKILQILIFETTLNKSRHFQFLENNLDIMLNDLDLKTRRYGAMVLN